MKSSLIILLLCSCFIAALAQQCSDQIPNCSSCDTNTTTICTKCDQLYKTNAIKSNCTYCPMQYCQSCQLQESKCYACIPGLYTQFKIARGADLVTCVPCQGDPFCQTCQIPHFCKFCSVNSALNPQTPDLNGEKCIQCTIANCLRCHQQDKCKICQNGYIHSISGQCKSCNVDNCISCSIDNYCQLCTNGFSLTTNGICIECSSPCFQCNDDGTCKTCQVPFWNSLVSTNSQNNGKCFRPKLKNCKEHQQSDNSKCSACNTFFEYDEDSNTCKLACDSFCLTCDSIDTSKCISCPQNYYLTNDNLCDLCPIGQTGGSAFATQCLNAKIGYYKTSFGEFKNCPGFCRNCLNPFQCTQLIFKQGRILLFDFISKIFKLAKCAGNCRQCAGGNPQFCVNCWDGFFNVQGICKPCDSSCKSCSAKSATKCNSCYFGAFLQSNSCISCDSNCLTCKSSTQLSTCTSCQDGWLLNIDTKICQQSCPQNCLKCDSTTNCLKCSTGFTTILDTGSDFLCIPCMQNCRTCMENQPSTCLECGEGFWTLTGQTCNPLEFTFCKRGDQQQCFECIDGYQLIDRLTCLPQCEYPCATCNPFKPTQCTSCIAGYTYQDSTQQCNPNTECNNDCNVCPFGYSLSFGNCKKCDSSLLNCERCDPISLTTCYSCNSGFYLDSTTSQCMDCPSQCKECFSSTQCSTCKAGNFLNHALKKCKPCSTAAGCATCNNQAAFCTTCLPGYSFNGWKCSKSEGLNVEITFSKSIIQFRTLYLKRFMIFFLGIFGLTDFNFFTLRNLVTFGSSTRIVFAIGYNFAFDQATADLKLKAAYDAIYGSGSIILGDLTVTGFKTTHSGGFANIFDNFCSVDKASCTKCDYNTTNCIQCPAQLSLVQNPGDGYCVSCNVQNCDECLITADVCSVCNNRFYLDDITNPDAPTCTPCTDVRCDICYQADSCALCLLGFVANQLSVCVPCTLTNCYQCDDPFYCGICQNQYDLDYSTGECFLCQLSNCNICQSSDRCSVCDTKNNFVVNFQTGLCQKCTVPGCQQCQTTTFCSKCSSGYSLLINTGECIPCSIPGCNNGCAIPNVCADTANCGPTEMIVISPFDQSQMICIACDIKNCIQCIWDNYCYTCDQSQVSTLSPDVFGQVCISCQVTDCAICWEADKCAFCLYPATLNKRLNKCVFCNVDNCLQCSSKGFCDICIDGYVSSSSGNCVTCPQICQTCLPTGQCIKCAQPYYNLLTSTKKDDFGLCFPRKTPNCITQDRNNHQVCIQCQDSYKWDKDKGECLNNCDPICHTCDPNQLSLCLSCRPGFFLDEDTCTACPLGCSDCNSTTCLIPFDRYFILIDGSIGQCKSKCKKCQSRKVCTQLQDSDGYALYIDQNGQSQILICAGSCQRCQNSQKCLDCRDGFYLKKDKQKDRQGICFPCDSSCKSCDRNDPTICTSCPDNYFLSNKKCKQCNENCLKCKSSLQPSVCTACINGRWLNKQNNTCIDGCPDNCLSCSSATSCIICNSGYTTLLDTVADSQTFNQRICTPCVVTCRQCVAGQPSNCITCGDGFYNVKGQCIACIQNCKTCNQKLCSACIDNYDLFSQADSSDKICAPSCAYPCSQCTLGKPSECTKCVAGYFLDGNSCTAQIQCTGSRGCNICPSNYVLDSGICVACPTPFCQQCWVDKKTTCLGCIVGYYLNDQNACQTCPTQCKDCFSPTQCISCKDGYILQKKKRKRGFQCIQCDEKCKTCKNNQNRCSSCADGYQLNGWKCDRIFKAALVHTFDCTRDQFFLQSRIIMFIFLKILGIKNPDAFSFLRIRLGSVILDSSVQLPGGSGSDLATAAFSGIKDAASAGTLGGLKVTSSSVLVKGGSLSSGVSSSNLGIILGICIPIGVLLIVGIIMFIVYKTKNVENYKFSQGQGTDRDNRGVGDSKAKIEYDDNSLI